MLSNILKDRVQVQEKTTTQTATGETEVWKPVQWLSARVIPLDAKARAVYQQLQSHVTHKVVLSGNVSLSLGKTRLIWGAKTLGLAEPPQVLGQTTVVMVGESNG